VLQWIRRQIGLKKLSAPFVMNLLKKTGCNANLAVSGHVKTAQAYKEPLVFVNVTFAKLRLTFNCLGT
jgi:hypothetical protein